MNMVILLVSRHTMYAVVTPLYTYGQDYTKTTSPTAHMESFCILAHLSTALDWEIEQLNIKTVFLNGILEPNEVYYMAQPEGFIKPGFKGHIWELQHGLYSIKQGSCV